MTKISLIVTTISKPNPVLKSLAAGCKKHKWEFIAIGDVASPSDFKLPGCDFYDLKRQYETGFKTANLCLLKHYARKNIGYLTAIKNGAETIVETDDDNYPLENFWAVDNQADRTPVLENAGWVNIYKYFTNENIWPRGLPLQYTQNKIKPRPQIAAKKVYTPILQGLAQGDPDVDAVYRLVLPLPLEFKKGAPVALGAGSWCPFNSQNTVWKPEAFPLLYLPSYCTFRMTDIWRSFIAQRIVSENGWAVLFRKASMRQDRNIHNYLKDFESEIPGYLQNENIQKVLTDLKLPTGTENIPDAMRLCYQALVNEKIIDAKELPVLDAWLEDLKKL